MGLEELLTKVVIMETYGKRSLVCRLLGLFKQRKGYLKSFFWLDISHCDLHEEEM